MIKLHVIFAVTAITLGCDVPDLVYKELDCKLLKEENGCPVAYDCDHIEARVKDLSKCYFHGKTYNSGEEIPKEETYPNCQIGCFCNGAETARITCAALDCPEWLGHRPDPGCHFKYDEDKCCSVGQVCPPFNVTCEVDGKKYMQGETFSPPDVKCAKCSCKEGFSGTFNEAYCRKQTCVSEIHDAEEIQKFCAPSYRPDNECCPTRWICPSDEDKIVKAAEKSGATDLKCKFGSKTLNYGDHFIRSNANGGLVTCTCLVPPYLTCKQDEKYPIFT